MFRTASRFSVVALGVLCVLAFAEPAAAQKSKVSKAKSSQVKSKATKSVPTARSRSIVKGSSALKSFKPKPSSAIFKKPKINVAPKGKTFGSSPVQRIDPFRSRGVTSVKPKVNTFWQPKGTQGKGALPKGTQVKPKVNTAPGSKSGSGITGAKDHSRTSSRTELDARERPDRGTPTSSGWGSASGSEISKVKRDMARSPAVGSGGDSFRTRPDRDRLDAEFVSRFRDRPTARAWDAARRRYDRLHRDLPRYHPGYTYWNGFWDGYSFGYHRGYHVGFHYAHAFHHHHLHHHYYGTHLVLGYHYGGFGYYANRWHFVLVIGAPLVTYQPTWYGYSWWDGYGASLASWDRYSQVYEEDYRFIDGSCVELHVATTDRGTYEIKIDPRYYDADDPGDLYAELWSELSTQGELRIQDLNGVIHIFPAGVIQQIEARPCR